MTASVELVRDSYTLVAPPVGPMFAASAVTFRANDHRATDLVAAPGAGAWSAELAIVHVPHILGPIHGHRRLHLRGGIGM
jgi:hypothetical protein